VVQGYQQPAQGYPIQQPVQPQQPAYGGYPAPDQGYAAPPAAAPGVGGITQGMGQMNIGAQPQQQGQAPRAAMNQLYPTDLLNQPFNATELDLPPPPITLPPNVSSAPDLRTHPSHPLTVHAPVERHSLSRRQLPPSIHPVHAQCCAYDAFHA
jgi:protein transport protein SEC24